MPLRDCFSALLVTTVTTTYITSALFGPITPDCLLIHITKYTHTRRLNTDRFRLQPQNHDWAAGATVVIDGGDAGGDAVGDAVGCPVVDWHWVLHSMVHHMPMPKAQYPSVRSGV